MDLPLCPSGSGRLEIQHRLNRVQDHGYVYLAGDYLLNGSINAAMTSGRIAAEAVIHSDMRTH